MPNIDSDKLMELIEEFPKSDGKLTAINVRNLIEVLLGTAERNSEGDTK